MFSEDTGKLCDLGQVMEKLILNSQGSWEDVVRKPIWRGWLSSEHHKCTMKDEVAEAGSQVMEALDTWLKFGFCHRGESPNDL